MADDLNHLSPHVLIFLGNSIILISQCMEMNIMGLSHHIEKARTSLHLTSL